MKKKRCLDMNERFFKTRNEMGEFLVRSPHASVFVLGDGGCGFEYVNTMKMKHFTTVLW